MSRIKRSFRLLKESFGVLRKDKELMLLPVLSALVAIVILATFLVPIFMIGPGGTEGGDEGNFGAVHYALMALMYIVLYTAGIYFQAALIAGATERLQGGDPTLGSALGVATKHLPRIIAWGTVAGSVGLVLRMIEQRSEAVGRIVAGLLGAAWTLATFFVVPTLVLEGVGVREAFGRSWGLFKKTWGETVVGSGGIGLASFLLILPIAGLVALLVAAKLVVLALVAGVVLGGLLMMFMSALQGVYVAALYRYATTGETAEGFDRADLEGAYRRK